MLLQQITPSMSKKMMRKGGGASAMPGTGVPLASVSGELLPGAALLSWACSLQRLQGLFRTVIFQRLFDKDQLY